MKCDVLFVDIACSKPYNWESLEQDSIGGTESSTIRLAEGFAKKGLSVIVIQRYDFPGTQSPTGVYYAPFNWLNQVTPKNVIHLRFRGLIDKFPGVQQFLWFHDAASENHNNPSGWGYEMKKYNVQGVCVSDWHKQNLLYYDPDMPLIRIYSPVDESCYSYPRPDKVDMNQLVWLSSPHKGLKRALELFGELKSEHPEFKLAVFNPGYYEEEAGEHAGVVFLPKQSKKVIRSVLSRSLCLFYPTQFEETFGLVASESNALGTPVASLGVAALAESATDKPFKTEVDLMKGVLEWQQKRPEVSGQARFRFNAIWPDWLKALKL